MNPQPDQPQAALTGPVVAPALHPTPLALSIFATGEAFEQAQRAAKLLAASDLMPPAFRNNIPNCVVGMEMANRLGASPFAVFQNLYVVHGRPSWSATFLIGMINASGRFSPLQFRMEGEGETRSCIAWAKTRETGEVVESPPVTMAMAKAEGWMSRNGSKWLTMPEVMLRYRAASFFAKFYAPDITLGMQTSEEVYDMEPQMRNVTRPPSLSEELAKAAEGTSTQQAPPTAPVAAAETPQQAPATDAAGATPPPPAATTSAASPAAPAPSNKEALLASIRERIEFAGMPELALEKALWRLNMMSATATLTRLREAKLQVVSDMLEEIIAAWKNGGDSSTTNYEGGEE